MANVGLLPHMPAGGRSCGAGPPLPLLVLALLAGAASCSSSSSCV